MDSIGCGNQSIRVIIIMITLFTNVNCVLCQHQKPHYTRSAPLCLATATNFNDGKDHLINTYWQSRYARVGRPNECHALISDPANNSFQSRDRVDGRPLITWSIQHSFTPPTRIEFITKLESFRAATKGDGAHRHSTNVN